MIFKNHSVLKNNYSETVYVNVPSSISPIYLSVIFSHCLAVRSHIPSDNCFIGVKQYKLGQGWARICNLPLLAT